MGGGIRGVLGVLGALNGPSKGAYVAYFPPICKNFASCGSKWSVVGG